MARSVREIVGERLVLLRRRKGWTQPELAREAGMSITTLNRVENAHTSLTMEKVAALARVLGTSADYLLGLTDELHPSWRRRKAEKQGEERPAADALVEA
jgi:transcriptional regulator with XRE-family HTH domain